MSYCRHGFSLVESLISLLMVSMAALLVIRMSSASAIVFQQATRKASAVRLTSELSMWVQRGGHLVLGMPLDQALDSLSDTSLRPPPTKLCCQSEECDSNRSAWQYLALWHDRFQRQLPDARWIVCKEDIAMPEASNWTCGATGEVLSMKLGWPSDAKAPTLTLPLGTSR
jgi:prepilin-type N-terminal cleavage/methylation domain-containing protein